MVVITNNDHSWRYNHVTTVVKKPIFWPFDNNAFPCWWPPTYCFREQHPSEFGAQWGSKYSVLGWPSLIMFPIDSRLQWSEQVSTRINKAKRAIHAIKLIKKHFNQTELKQLLTANYYSILYYNCKIWLKIRCKSIFLTAW